jgi:hypothetical protein
MGFCPSLSDLINKKSLTYFSKKRNGSVLGNVPSLKGKLGRHKRCGKD